MSSELFYCAPRILRSNSGFEELVRMVRGGQRVFFLKLNHGFWERLAKLERAGIPREDFDSTEGSVVDELLGISGTQFAEGGLLKELLSFIKNAPSPKSGFHFIPSMVPWLASDVIEGTPMENKKNCQSLIKHFTPASHLRHNIEVGFTGHELKSAAISGCFHTLLEALADRTVILIGNRGSRALFDKYVFKNFEFLEVDSVDARLKRHQLLRSTREKIAAFKQDSALPVVLTAAGGAMSCWLGFHLWRSGVRAQFVDLGGVPNAYSAPAINRANWVLAYERQFELSTKNMLPDFDSAALFRPAAYGIRDPDLVQLAHSKGVPLPSSVEELASVQSSDSLTFIENKIYDYSRINELLSLSVRDNHHANHGPMTRLLEEAIRHIIHLNEGREVVAVSSGTAALHLACGYTEYTSGKAKLRWVTSSFNFFSASLGPLKDVTYIDCEADGRFSLKALQALPLDSYDAVVLTNIFAQYPDWGDVIEFCECHSKWLVIDNATGLLDRPASAKTLKDPIEIISAHHTKPWGVGEGGFIICDYDQASVMRKLSNFGVGLPGNTRSWAANYKISDLASAAIYDRLERMPHWAKFYKWQSRRMKSLMLDSNLNIKPLTLRKAPISPVAHTPFIAPIPFEPISSGSRPITIRKYYRPLISEKQNASDFPFAQNLFAHIFSLPNSPEHRLLTDEVIMEEVHYQLMGKKIRRSIYD